MTASDIEICIIPGMGLVEKKTTPTEVGVCMLLRAALAGRNPYCEKTGIAALIHLTIIYIFFTNCQVPELEFWFL
jgi:hypothetical protein